MEDRNLLDPHEIIKICTPKLVLAICDCINDVSDHCLSWGLITEDQYDDIVLCQVRVSTDKARRLLRDVRHVVKMNSGWFEEFLYILNETLPHATKDQVIDDLMDRYLATGNQHPQFDLRHGDLRFVHFTGPLATKKFQKLDRDFCEDLSACNIESVMSRTEEILSANTGPYASIDYKCISLVHRAKCKAHCLGQRDEALLDCHEAIERASKLECENGVLIIGRALAMSASIQRWSERYSEAQGYVDRAKSELFLAAPSNDTAALLYEEVRMKISFAMSKKEDINISEVQNDYDRIFTHALCLNAHDRSRLCAYVNALTEVYLQTYYLDEGVPFSAIPLPTESDLHRAEKILNSYPLKELPTKPHGNRGWYYRNRADLCMWRRQYSKAIKWAEKAQTQFTQARMKHITNPKKRIELYQRLQSKQMMAKRSRQKQWVAFLILLFSVSFLYVILYAI